MAEFVEVMRQARRMCHNAEKNPVQPYPTWIEYQQEVFPNYTRQICPMVFGIECTSNGTGCHECRNNPIPAEIAEKLGIEPKEG